MPSRYIIRSFEENHFYHIFNRGLEKRQVFKDDQDYQIFKYYMFVYLAPLDKILSRFPDIPIRLQARNLEKELDLVVYCLMPNHFHLLLRTQSKDAISKFMRQLINAYTRYFNNKYERFGNLLHGRFKAAHLPSDEMFLHVSRYIHLNPVVAELSAKPEDYKWSSYTHFVEVKDQEVFLKKQLILDHFSKTNTYRDFVEDQIDYAKTLDKLKHLIIE